MDCMKTTIQIDDDVLNYLKSKQQNLEDASAILRRLLGIRPDTRAEAPFSRRRRSKYSGFRENFEPAHSVDENGRAGESSVDECILSFRAQRDVVQKFLFALSWLAKKHKEDFKRVFELRGRKRMYFAESQETIEESGTKVMPQQIPDTNYWVVTNNDTPKKQRILYDVLHVLGYSVGDCNRLSGALQ
jgi:negative modulator of initiation of replication